MQKVQDFFAKTMDVASLSLDESGPITQPSNFTEFCIKHTRGSDLGFKHCNECDIKWGKIAAEKGKPVIYKCHAGLTDFVVPVIIESIHIFSIYGGQVLTESPDKEKFRKIAKKINVDEEEYLEALSNIKVIPIEKIEAAVKFLSIVANSISAIAYANLQLKELGLDYKPNKTIPVEEWFFSNCTQIKTPITPREFDVLKLIVMGKTNTEIAKELFISVHTAKAHVSSILEKMLVEDRVQVAVKAIREGLLD